MTNPRAGVMGRGLYAGGANLHKRTLGRATFLAAALGGFLLLGSTAPVQARDRDNRCARRIHQAEEKLEKEIRRHGEHSRQAEKRRRELENARRGCRGDRDRDDRRDRDRR
jgi:hypothetical protein